MKTDLKKYDNSDYNPGANIIKRVIWYFVNIVVFRTGLFPISSLKVLLLRLFGARIGKKVNIKPFVNIKFPWFLRIGDHVWVGEQVWIDNLTIVTIGNNACLSQGAMLLTGNHNFQKATFDLITSEIIVEDGAWIGAQSIVCPGVICGSHSVLTVGSVATKNLDPYSIYSGNAAIKVKDRKIVN